MSASAQLLLSALSKQPAGPDVENVLPATTDVAPDVCVFSAEGNCAETPLTSEPPMSDAEPLTSEPPLADAAHLTSEPVSAGAAEPGLHLDSDPSGM
ncbi:hypothetical protein [Streptomyces minutiscleroticus]|uniref:Secreted protein n=1 Tax=Streptomyces minutiscleroticus TaxID=68238 RepID=A0A918N9B3_9ACTN|nr:hypothetical protein [Streptomyces minutiscleroticus]GGX50664.1 hypothetical protein GCM10010358_00190 [Streptomyces minutiscleroticus]